MESKTLLVLVKEIRDQASEIKSFELESVDGTPLPPFEAGAHIDVHVAAGIVRQYSLCNGPGDTAGYTIAVKKEGESRGGSRAMHDQLQAGQQVRISAPRNHFGLAPQASGHLLIGGGIGITPLLSMARHLLAAGAGFSFHYFARSVEHVAFHQLLSGPQFGARVRFHLGLAPEAVRATLDQLLAQRADGAHLYLCGPGPFMNQVVKSAAAWPEEAIHLEHFAAAPELLAGAQESFEVTLAHSGATYAIPAGESIVDVLARHGVAVDVSCEQGVCGTCVTGVIEGTPDHRDMFLSDQEKKSCKMMTLCVSRARSRKLVLDL